MQISERLSDLLDEYFVLGVAEGREGRTHDTKAGDAQRVRSEIEAALSHQPAPIRFGADIEGLIDEISKHFDRRIFLVSDRETATESLRAVLRPALEAALSTDVEPVGWQPMGTARFRHRQTTPVSGENSGGIRQELGNQMSAITNHGEAE